MRLRIPAAGAVELRNGTNAAVVYCDAARTTRQWRYEAYVVGSASAADIDAVAAPYDDAHGSALWTFGFSFVLAFGTCPRISVL